MSDTPYSVDPGLLAGNRRPLAGYEAQRFLWQVEGTVATLTLNRPERKNPLTFESYAELRDLFRNLVSSAARLASISAIMARSSSASRSTCRAWGP